METCIELKSKLKWLEFTTNTLHYFMSQLIVWRGTQNEDRFRYATDPTEQRVWKERIAPYIEEEIYTVKHNFMDAFSMKYHSIKNPYTKEKVGSFILLEIRMCCYGPYCEGRFVRCIHDPVAGIKLFRIRMQKMD